MKHALTENRCVFHLILLLLPRNCFVHRWNKCISTLLLMTIIIIIVVIIARPRLAFGWLGLGGLSGGYSSHC